MCNCPDSPWVRSANVFLGENQDTANEGWFTVNFLIQNHHCGIARTVSIEKILNYLSENGIDISREKFQQTTLGELKREGIVATLVYPGPSGGVFIPCKEEELSKVANQVLKRVDSEIENLAGMLQHTSFQNVINDLAQEISRLRDNI